MKINCIKNIFILTIQRKIFFFKKKISIVQKKKKTKINFFKMQ